MNAAAVIPAYNEAATIASVVRSVSHVGTVIVVDDVMTTGSTLNACARTLQAQGTQQVIAWVLGRRVHEPMVQEVGSH